MRCGEVSERAQLETNCSKAANEQHTLKHMFSQCFAPGNFGGVLQEEFFI